MNRIERSRRLAAVCAAAALLALASGCNAQDADVEQQPTEPAAQAQPQPQTQQAQSPAPGGPPAQQEELTAAGGAPAALGPVALGTFTAPEAESATGLESRLPAEPARTILVPDSALYPGAARLDPGIENPYAGQAAIDAGERHFAAFNCAGCHAPLGGGGMGPPLSDDVWIHGSEPAQIFLSIMHGRPEGMPAWSSMLPARTVWELVAYVQSLSEIEDYAAEKGFNLRGTEFAAARGERNAPADDAEAEAQAR